MSAIGSPIARHHPGTYLGARLYDIEGVRFVGVWFSHDDRSCWAFSFAAVDRANYKRLYRIAIRCRRDAEPPAEPPILPPQQLDTLWTNTIG